MGWTRRWMGLTASLVGLAPGSAVGDGARVEEERHQDAESSLESPGTAASGPSFYVWDEDPERARRWAAELARPPVLKDDDFA